MKSGRKKRLESGIVLLTTLLLILLLMAMGMSGLSLSRSDLLVSRNLLLGVQSLWTARAGLEVGKNWLETNLPGAMFPLVLGPTAFADGSYSVSIQSLGNGAYRFTSIGIGLEESRRVVEETVRLPPFTPVGVITSDGDGLHPDFNDDSGGIGRRIPDFTIDGRNHALDGSLSPLCPACSPFVVTQVNAQNDLTNATDTLKREIVTRANTFCLANGDNAAGPCTPGLFWVRGNNLLPRFQTGACAASDPSCFLTLNLSSPALRAMALPPVAYLPPAPDDHGPLTTDSGISFVRTLNATERTQLQTALTDLTQRVEELPDESVSHISSSLHGGLYTYGSLTKPAVVRIDMNMDALDVDNGTVINGIGVLLVPRVVRLSNATFNWKGIIVITGAGDLRAENAAVCGQVLGAILVHDDAALDRKLDLDRVQSGGGCAPFAINYSCEAVTRALTTLMHTVSWIEKYGV